MRRPLLVAGVLAALACAGAPVVPPPEPTVPVAPGTDTAAPAPEPAPRPRERRKRPRRPVPAPAEPAPEEDEDRGPPTTKPRGITQTGERSWTVTRALADRWHEDPYRLGDAREAGDGWALVGVRQRHAWHLGMRNRDVILEVNGHRLASRSQLLLAYLDLKNDTAFEVVFVRDGERRVHHYRIVD